MRKLDAKCINRAVLRGIKILLFPGVWMAFLAFDVLTLWLAGLGPIIVSILGITSYASLCLLNALMRSAGRFRKNASFSYFRLATSVLVIVAIVVASVTIPIIVNATRDPLAQDASECMENFSASSSNGDGEVATIGHAYCNAWHPYAIDAVFVHKTVAGNDLGSLALRYYPSVGMEAPTVKWNNPRNLTIGLKTTNEGADITAQRTSVDGIQIHYDVRLECSGSAEASLSNGEGDVASLRITSCARGKDAEFYYIRSLFLHKVGTADSSSNLAFQYEPTVRGVEFDPPELRWMRKREIRMSLKCKDIAKISNRRSGIDGYHIVYDIEASK